MPKAKLLRVEIEIEPEDIPWEEFASGVPEYDAEDRARIEAGTMEYVRYHVGVEYGLPTEDTPGSLRIHRTGDSLGGIGVLTGSVEERNDTNRYMKAELTNSVNVLAAELSKFGIPKASVQRLGREAIEDALLEGRGVAEAS